MRKIGILGGTFNPIHLGHLLLAERAMEQLELEEVWLIPAGIPYKKKDDGILSGEERLCMTELAVAENDRLRCLDLEVKRSGYTYSYETMEELKESYPDVKFYFLVGADCLFSLENWKKPEELLKSCVLTAAFRSDATPERLEAKRQELLARFGGEIELLSFPRIDISSSEIRKNVAEGKSIRYMVPAAVRNYIEKKGFYRE